MRTRFLLLLSLAACERADPSECPDGTRRVNDLDVRPGAHCELPGGKWHGPTFDLLPDGGVRLRGRLDHGVREGTWRTYWPDDSLRSETTYRAGKRDGPGRIWQDGELVFEKHWRAGRRHGLSLSRDTSGGQDEAYFDDGLRTGTWRHVDASGAVSQIRIYARGILLAVDGRPLPAPPAWIDLSDRRVQRTDCARIEDAPRLEQACAELFEAYQRCQLDPPTGPACRTAARRRYLDSTHQLARE